MILNIGKAVDCLPDEVGLDTDIYVQAPVDIELCKLSHRVRVFGLSGK